MRSVKWRWSSVVIGAAFAMGAGQAAGQTVKLLSWPQKFQVYEGESTTLAFPVTRPGCRLKRRIRV